MENSEVLIPITMFLAAFGALYVFFTTRNKERMAMIEKGADPALFKSRPGNRTTTLKFGMFLIGIALGILMGNVLEVTTRIEEQVAYFSMIFLFGGLSLVIFYMWVGRNKELE
jgi:hypothetical protein